MAIRRPKIKKKTPEEIENDRILDAAEEEEVEFDWEYDDDADWSWMSAKERENPHEVFYCRATHPDGRVESLSGIFDPDSDYKREVEADLARELGIKAEFVPPNVEDMHTVYNYDESVLQEEPIDESGPPQIPTAAWEEAGRQMEENHEDTCAYRENGDKSESRVVIQSRNVICSVILEAWQRKDNREFWTVYRMKFYRSGSGLHYNKFVYEFAKVLRDNLPHSVTEFVTEFNKGRDVYSQGAIDSAKHQKMALKDLKAMPEIEQMYDEWIRLVEKPVEIEDMHAVYNYDESIVHQIERTLVEMDPDNHE